MSERQDKRILIVNPFGIGDVLFTTPIIEAIIKENPDAYIGYVCNIRTAPFISVDPRIKRTFIFERDEYRELWKISKQRCVKKLFGLIKEIRSERFEAVLDLSLAREYGFFLWLAGIRKRAGYNFRGRGIFLTKRLELKVAYHLNHTADYYMKLLPLLDIEAPQDKARLSIHIPQEYSRKAEDMLSRKGITHDKGFICIAPGGGSSWGGTSFRKQWPKEKFLKVAGFICNELKLKTALIGSKDDKPICEHIREKEKGCIDICGETDLLTSAAIISKAKLLVTNDGGLLHIAVAAGTDTVSIFGPVDDKVYGPYPVSERHVVIKNNSLDCRPCYSNFKIPECDHRKCLNDISTDTVMEAIRKRL